MKQVVCRVVTSPVHAGIHVLSRVAAITVSSVNCSVAVVVFSVAAVASDVRDYHLQTLRLHFQCLISTLCCMHSSLLELGAMETRLCGMTGIDAALSLLELMRSNRSIGVDHFSYTTVLSGVVRAAAAGSDMRQTCTALLEVLLKVIAAYFFTAVQRGAHAPFTQCYVHACLCNDMQSHAVLLLEEAVRC
jgi:hypothetical protein